MYEFYILNSVENEEEINKMMLALIIIHVIISVALVIVVLMQHGKQQGLSGAIAGGAETFFGKNKGRTVGAMLKKFTAVVAILFVVSSILLAALSIKDYNSTNAAPAEEAPAAGQMGTLDENGNLVDENGNILMTKEDIDKQMAATEEAPAEEAPAEEAPAEEAPATEEAPAE